MANHSLKLQEDCIRQRTGCGVHPFRKRREEMRIEAVGLASCPVALTIEVSYPPVASRTISVGARTRTRSMAAVMPGASFDTVQDAPAGRQATTKRFGEPTKVAVGVIRPPRDHGSVFARPCGYGITPPRNCGVWLTS
jgi:hypothetical protein